MSDKGEFWKAPGRLREKENPGFCGCPNTAAIFTIERALGGPPGGTSILRTEEVRMPAHDLAAILAALPPLTFIPANEAPVSRTRWYLIAPRR